MAGAELGPVTSRSPEQTEGLGEAIGRELEAGAVVALDGELGAGKTLFVQGLARGLGVEEPVTSPSFTLMHEYRGRLALHHFDAWMAGREAAFLEDGGAELLGGEGVCAVEWARRVEAWLPVPHLEVELCHRGPRQRRLSLRIVHGPPGTSRRDLPRALEAAREVLARAGGLERVPESGGSD